VFFGTKKDPLYEAGPESNSLKKIEQPSYWPGQTAASSCWKLSQLCTDVLALSP
jgi:hypothetical protein